MLDGTGGRFKYRVYGVTLQANRPLPGLVPASAHALADIHVHLMRDRESQLPSAEVERVSSGLNIRSKADGTYFHLWFRGDGQLDFEVDAEGCSISATWTRSVLEEVTALLLGPVLGCALRLRGMLCLHACVVRLGQHAIALVGPTGTGKSTTAAALARQGHAILSDDIAVLNDLGPQWLAQPGYPRLRLWPASIHALYGSEAGLARIFSFTEKRFVDLTDHTHQSAWRFYREPLPLAAIYVLGARQSGLADTTIEPISPAPAVMTLMGQRSANHFDLTLDAEQQVREFADLSRLAMRVPVRKVTRSDRLDALPQLCDALEEDVARLDTPEICTQP
ncbi:MAG: hypothetical protein ETSY1_02485 [Candidatus Entotheonella factor]|uniref:HPr kinase/phosphorylase C-terminal domain-containing protein n=1 Tax=Entotheonella factor TaxID=1429438 RepID=W4LYB9_ENTF1|nr:serine/threonine protein kinase [Candidatus Entotheonella palauensis]ETX02746.1 MAG: hypothetical protein ETSY1_02485 [Candidatus Entotheonella factor]